MQYNTSTNNSSISSNASISTPSVGAIAITVPLADYTFSQPLLVPNAPHIAITRSELAYSNTMFQLASLFPFECFDLKNQGNSGFRVDDNGETYIEVQASLRAYVDDPDSEVAKYVGGHSVLKVHVYGQNLHLCSDAEADFLKKVMLNAQYRTAAEYLHEAARHSLLADAKVPGLAADANALLNSDWLDIFDKQLHARFDTQ